MKEIAEDAEGRLAEAPRLTPGGGQGAVCPEEGVKCGHLEPAQVEFRRWFTAEPANICSCEGHPGNTQSEDTGDALANRFPA